MADTPSNRATKTRESQQFAKLNNRITSESSKGSRQTAAYFLYGVSVTALFTLCAMILSSIVPQGVIVSCLAVSAGSLEVGLSLHGALSQTAKMRSAVMAIIVLAVHCAIGVAIWPGVLSVSPSLASLPGTKNSRLTLEMKNNTNHSLYSAGMGFYVDGAGSSIDDFAFAIPRNTHSEMDPTLPGFIDSLKGLACVADDRSPFFYFYVDELESSSRKSVKIIHLHGSAVHISGKPDEGSDKPIASDIQPGPNGEGFLLDSWVHFDESRWKVHLGHCRPVNYIQNGD